MSLNPYSQLVGQAFKQSKDMSPVGAGKSPIVGFVLGFVFGPLGVGLYLRSFTDFAMSLGMVIIGTLMTAGIAAPVLWAICGAWAAVRISNSNAQHGAPSGATPH